MNIKKERLTSQSKKKISDLDPWRGACLTNASLTGETVQLLETGSSHCADAALHYNVSGTPPLIKEAQERQMAWFRAIFR